ncbi:MAG TPA: SemiSWEET transporter [Patescibacteria group bacterium]
MIETIGLIAAFCTTISFLPQAIHTFKTKNTKGISLQMYLILTTGVGLWFVYGLFIQSYPIIFANAVTFVFALSILILKIKHG